MEDCVMNPTAVGSCGRPTERVGNHKLSPPIGRRENRRGSGEGRPPGSSRLGGSLRECGSRVGCGLQSSEGLMETEEVNQ